MIVRAGLAVGYLPESVVRQAGHKRDFVAVAGLDFGVIDREVGFFHLEKRPLSDLAREFMGLARRLPDAGRKAAPRLHSPS